MRTKWGCSCSGLAYLFEDWVVGLLLVCHVYLRGVPRMCSSRGTQLEATWLWNDLRIG